MEKYFLSFDCATKTFAFILIKINFKYLFVDTKQIRKILNQIISDLKKNNYNDKMLDIINTLDNNTKNAIQIITGNCVDLVPNIANKDINTVDRIKIMVKYVKDEIFPLIKDIKNEDLCVLVEFQMSHNTQSKIISIALLTLFAEYELCLVKPCLKNKIYLTNEGQYYNFIKKYNNNYTANKQHALYNFKEFERIFDQNINISDKLKGHIADSFMQILGYIVYQ
jgi:hypothetical protein